MKANINAYFKRANAQLKVLAVFQLIFMVFTAVLVALKLTGLMPVNNDWLTITSPAYGMLGFVVCYYLLDFGYLLIAECAKYIKAKLNQVRVLDNEIIEAAEV